MKKNLICLDWDGTIIANQHVFVSCVQYAIKKLNLKSYTEDEIKGLFGSDKKTIEQSLKANFTEFWDVYNKQYRKHKAVLHRGAKNFLTEHKKHFHLTIVSNKDFYILEPEIQSLLPENTFDFIFSASEYKAKPDPCMLNLAMQKFNSHPETTFMIGDSLVDAKTAKNANVKFIPVYAQWNEESTNFEDLCLY